MVDVYPIRRALISVSDKTGLADFARRLAALGVELVSTGGTAAALREAGLEVRDVASLTGFPEMMAGRVKTLHPGVHGGLLARRDDPSHMADLAAHGLAAIDLLVVNLYPFERTRASGADDALCIENIDVGGPAMIRAAAKNHAGVGVIVDPEDYALAGEIEARGGLGGKTRRALAAKAFAHTAAYDAAIAAYLEAPGLAPAPQRFTAAGALAMTLRYGENPHQDAALYLTGDAAPGAATARLIQGKPLSYNNINDTDAAYELIGELGDSVPAVAIIKHANPCGVAMGETLLEAYLRALRCDPVSAFGGIVAFNRPIDAETAAKVSEIFTEVIIAPSIEESALAIFRTKKNLRVLAASALPDPRRLTRVYKPVAGGILVQTCDNVRIERENLKVVTRRSPTRAEVDDMMFAFAVAKHVKSNAIVYAKDGAVVAVGAGQMSRLDSCRIAAQKAAEAAAAAGLAEPLTVGSVVASDAFFPFADGMLAAVAAGATAVIQPGGSVRDEEVIEAADRAGVAMAFTGLRHFRH